MANYILRRMVYSIILIILSASLIFAIVHAAPGSPFARMINEMYSLNPNLRVPPTHWERLNSLLGLDQPLPMQYLKWLRGIFTGNLGESWAVASGQPVVSIIMARLPYSLILLAAASLAALIVAIPLGVYSATHQYTESDFIITGATYLGAAMPAFWVGTMLIAVFSSTLNWLPYGNVSSPELREYGDLVDALARILTLGLTHKQMAGQEGAVIVDGLRHLVLPVFVLMLWPAARWTRTLRFSMLETLNQEYVRTARAKGVSQRAVVFKHSLRNALVPLVTVMALDIPTLFMGLYVVEYVFSWPGIGRLFMEALINTDWPLLTGLLVINAILIIALNLFADLIYPLIDPRITYVNEKSG
jgi:peptide/nickel transport system permease protein